MRAQTSDGYGEALAPLPGGRDGGGRHHFCVTERTKIRISHEELMGSLTLNINSHDPRY